MDFNLLYPYDIRVKCCVFEDHLMRTAAQIYQNVNKNLTQKLNPTVYTQPCTRF